MIHSLRAMLADVDLAEGGLTISAPSPRRGTTLSHLPGGVVVRQGSLGPGPQLVVEGSAEVGVDGVAGTTMAPGAHFAEISLLDHRPGDRSGRARRSDAPPSKARKQAAKPRSRPVGWRLSARATTR